MSDINYEEWIRQVWKGKHCETEGLYFSSTLNTFADMESSLSSPPHPLLFLLTVLRKEMLRLNVGSPTGVDNRQNNMSSEIKLVNFVYTAISLYALQDPNPNKLSPGLSAKSNLFTLLVFLRSDLD